MANHNQLLSKSFSQFTVDTIELNTLGASSINTILKSIPARAHYPLHFIHNMRVVGDSGRYHSRLIFRKSMETKSLCKYKYNSNASILGRASAIAPPNGGKL